MALDLLGRYSTIDDCGDSCLVHLDSTNRHSAVKSRADAAGSKQGSIISSARAQALEKEQGRTSMRFRPLLGNLRAAVGLNTASEKQNIA